MDEKIMEKRKTYQPWILKYRPKSTNEIQGQNTPIKTIIEFIQNFKNQRQKALIIFGSTGNGKTQTVHAIAKDLDKELIEINASDFRNADKINNVIGNAIRQQSLFMKEKLILVDEVDNLSATKDRGALQAIQKLIDETTYPIVCTANNIYDKKFKAFRAKTVQVQFKTLTYISVAKVLEKILDAEEVEYNPEAIKSFARFAQGDLRAAINDLQMIASTHEKITSEVIEQLSERDKTEKITNALLKIFKTKDFKIAQEAMNEVDEDASKQILWLEHNIPKEYEKLHEIHKALSSLGDATMFLNRINRWQYWRFLVYVFTLSSCGVALAKDEKYRKFTSYAPTDRILKIWQANIRNAQKKDILAKLQPILHGSQKQHYEGQTMTLLKTIAKNDSQFLKKIESELELSATNITWLKK